jgi:hypothetical protein
MKCPKCGKEGCKYIEKKKMDDKGKMFLPRTNFKAKCKCGWEGEI